MFKEEDDKCWDQFHDLTEIMEKTPQKQASNGLTSIVMSRIYEENKEIKPFSLKSFFPSHFDFRFEQTVTKTECAFYFLLTGFFYFILGLIMMIGLPLPVIIENNSWLSLQPAFGLLLAAELFLMGIIIYKRGDSAVHVVRIGTLLYAALLILNFGIGTLFVQSGAAVFLIAVFSMAGLVLAMLLALAVEHYCPKTFFSEVRR